jgi:hypothetical protein
MLYTNGFLSGINISSPPKGIFIVSFIVSGTKDEPAIPTAAYPSRSKISPALLDTIAVTKFFFFCIDVLPFIGVAKNVTF